MSRHGPRATRIRRRAVGVATAAALAALPLSMAVFSSPATAAEPHVDNPYAGAVQYVNPTWAASVRAAAARQSDASLRAKMETVAQQPTAVWMDRISAITGNADGNGLKFHLDEAVKQQRAAGKPLVFNIVIYDLPGRDCYALASNGELPATDAGLARYKSEYIDPIAALLAKPEYSGLRISATIEPDSLPNLVTNSSEQLCQQAAPYYRAGVKYALDKLHAISNVYNYIDVAHSGWLGWDSNAGPAAQLFAEVAKSTTAGFASVDGFVSDVANSTPLEEPFLTNSSMTLNNNPIRSSKFYEWNFDFDEIDFTAHMHSLLVQAGFPSSLGMLIDTSRNGWGGPNRPTKVSTSTDINTYVDQSRVDRRVHRGAWCNPLGAGIGELPRATPSGYTSSHLDAFVWIKPPGESDGASSEIENDQGKHFDRMCDPTFVSPKLANQLTGATPNAPLAGQIDVRNFAIVNEARLQSIVSKPPPGADRSLNQAVRRDLDVSQAKFERGFARVEKGADYLSVSDGVVRGPTIGSTFQGKVFDGDGNMAITGTFMPAYGLNRIFGEIPILGQILGNGRDRGLIGITFKLSGKTSEPQLAINPLSIVAPGIFRSIFEYR